ncbi:MAG: helix-turn-helix domain-containing protein [Clostridia bacterium]|nr:helix-turn-helix domain-containing protein [Clostridia bacterium]
MSETVKRVFSREETAETMGIGLITLDALIRRQDDPLPHIRVGRRVLIPIREFDDWLSRQAEKAVAS